MPGNDATLPPTLPVNLHEPVTRAEADLRRVMGRLGERVQFRWGWNGAVSPRTVTLTLEADGSTKSTELFDFEFAEPVHVRRRLRQVWSDVLADQLDRFWDKSQADPEMVGGH